MQVSWIDPDEIRDLVRQLEGPKTAAATSAWEVHTLPTSLPVNAAPDDLMNGEPLPSARAAPAHDPDPPLGESRGGPAHAELWRIRERLRVLRDKAQTAGILARSAPEDAPPQAEASPFTAVEAPAVAETSPVPVPAPDPAPLPEEESPPPAEAEVAASEAVDGEVEGESQPERAVEASLEEVQEPEGLSAPTIPSPALGSPFDRVEVPVYEPLFAVNPPPAEPSASFEEPAPASIPVESLPPAVAEIPTASTPVPEKAPFTLPARLGLSDRLNSVAAWACARLGTQEVLLVDDYGDVLWGAEGQTALVLSAMMAWHSAQRASASATCTDPERIDKPLGANRALTVLPMRTRYGVISLAAIQREPVADDDAMAIRDALALAVEGAADA